MVSESLIQYLRASVTVNNYWYLRSFANISSGKIHNEKAEKSYKKGVSFGTMKAEPFKY